MNKYIQIIILLALFSVASSVKFIHTQDDQEVAVDKSAQLLQIYNLHATQWRTQTLTKFTKTSGGYQSLRSTRPLRRGTIVQVTLKVWTGTYSYFGISVNPDGLFGEYVGQTENSWGYYCYDGAKYTRATAIPYATKCSAGDKIKMKIDLTQGKGTVQYYLNGLSLGLAWGGLLGLNKDIYFAFGAYYANDSIEVLSYKVTSPV